VPEPPSAEKRGKGDGSAEIAKRKMMAACQRDPQLQEQLFNDPDAVAQRFNVALSDTEKQQLRRVAELRNLIDDFKSVRDTIGPGPIFYPIDGWWWKRIFYHVRFYPKFYHVFYPAGNVFDTVGSQSSMASRLRPPDWVFYPHEWGRVLVDRVSSLSQRVRELQMEISRMRGGGM
jgi:hypothetical protein